MKNKDKLKHYILGFDRRPSGAFEYSWRVGQNLKNRGFDVDYLAHWWNSPVRRVDLMNESKKILNFIRESRNSGIYHLHTHTWEHDGLLSEILKNSNSRLLYTLHAIIPYIYFNDKDAFLKGEISVQEMMKDVKPKMSNLEMFQLSAIEKADYLLTISEAHKKILERMNPEKSVYVFENVSDIDSLDDAILYGAYKSGLRVRDELNSENVVLYCGTISGNKGSPRLIEAFQEIRNNCPSSKLILLGGDVKERGRIFLENLGEKNLEGIIRVPWINKTTPMGQVDFLKYYYASDVLIHPMITEGLFSRTVIDAMSMGLPTITCKSPYSVGSSRTKDEIIESFFYMKNNSDDVGRIVELARKKVARENTWDSYISRMEELISQ